MDLWRHVQLYMYMCMCSVHVHVHGMYTCMYVYSSCSAKPAQHERYKREGCEGFALQLFCWKLLSNRHVLTLMNT